MRDGSFCSLRSLIFGAKLQWNSQRCDGCQPYEVTYVGVMYRENVMLECTIAIHNVLATASCYSFTPFTTFLCGKPITN